MVNMRSIAVLSGLIAAALAVPTKHIANINKRQVENRYTRINPNSRDVIVITEENTVNGTYHTDELFTVDPEDVDVAAQTLKLSLVNNLGDGINMYLSGTDSDNRVFFLGADGNLIYPSSGGSAAPVLIEAAIGVPMPAQGQSLDITVPIAFASGRIYFARGNLEFFMVSIGGGQDGLVQPSIHNPDDPSRSLNWGFVEMTLTPEGVIWSNISFVDFVGLIMSMTLQNTDGSVQEVVGLPGNAVGTLCQQLTEQGNADGYPWGASCVAGSDGQPLRVMAPQDATGFDNYWTEYIDQVWAKYASEPLTINTQNGDVGDVECRVNGNQLECDGDNRPYPKPVAFDIWGCNTGPFNAQPGTDNAVHLAVVPRLCAAFVRSTLLLEGGNRQPELSDDSYYTVNPTHHYSRLVHENEIDGKGYAFPYDDVNPDGSDDAAGLISSANHDVLTFHIGGKA